MADAQRGLTHGILLLMLAMYTAFAAGPFAWTAILSVRRTSDIMQAPFAWPEVWHWEKYVDAWVGSNYATYFSNSVIIVVTSVALVTIIGAAAAHALARYRFRGNRVIYFLIFPPSSSRRRSPCSRSSRRSSSSACSTPVPG
jgi:ABC-type glycerol-3-phosphate transport system permease component